MSSRYTKKWCKFGHKCKYVKQRSCRFNHHKSDIPCRYGKKCHNMLKSKCKFYHDLTNKDKSHTTAEQDFEKLHDIVSKWDSMKYISNNRWGSKPDHHSPGLNTIIDYYKCLQDVDKKVLWIYHRNDRAVYNTFDDDTITIKYVTLTLTINNVEKTLMKRIPRRTTHYGTTLFDDNFDCTMNIIYTDLSEKTDMGHVHSIIKELERDEGTDISYRNPTYPLHMLVSITAIVDEKFTHKPFHFGNGDDSFVERDKLETLKTKLYSVLEGKIKEVLILYLILEDITDFPRDVADIVYTY